MFVKITNISLWFADLGLSQRIHACYNSRHHISQIDSIYLSLLDLDRRQGTGRCLMLSAVVLACCSIAGRWDEVATRSRRGFPEIGLCAIYLN